MNDSKIRAFIFTVLVLLSSLFVPFIAYGADTHSQGSVLLGSTPTDNGFPFELDFSWRILGPAKGSKPPESIIGHGLRGYDYDVAVTITPRRIGNDEVLIDGTKYGREQLGDVFDKVTLYEVHINAKLQAGGPGGPTWSLEFQAGTVNMVARFDSEREYWISGCMTGASLSDGEIFDMMISDGLRIVDAQISDHEWAGIRSARNEIRRQKRQADKAQHYLSEAQRKLNAGWYDDAIADAGSAVEADPAVKQQADAIVAGANEAKTREEAHAADDGGDAGDGAGAAGGAGGSGQGSGTSAAQTAGGSSAEAASGTVRVPPPPPPQLDWAQRYEEAGNKLQRQMEGMNNALDDLHEGFADISRQIDRDRRWSAATNLETSGQSPEQMIRQVEEKKRELERQTRERRDRFNRKMDKIEADLASQGQQSGTTALVTGVARLGTNAALERQRKKAERELREQLEEAFRDIQEDIIEDIDRNLDAAEKGRAQTINPEEFDYFEDVIDYFERYRDSVQEDFSIDDTDWTRPSGSQPSKPRLGSRPSFTPSSLVSFLERKYDLAYGRGEHSSEARAALDLITAWGVNEYPDRPESYYYRSLLTGDPLDSYLLSYRASELEKNSRYSRQAEADLRDLTQDFFQAVDRYNSGMLKRASNAGVVPLMRSSRGENAYLYAARHNTRSLDLLLSFISAGEKDSFIQNLLIVAAGEGIDEAVSVLISRGADAQERDRGSGMTPIQVAAAAGHLDVIENLVQEFRADAGAAMEDAQRRGFASARYYLGEYLVSMAVKSDDPSELDRVMRYEPSVLHAEYRDGTSYLGYAVVTNKTRLLRYVLQQGVSPNARDSSGMPLLAIAIEHNSSEDTVRALVNAGASLDTVDSCWRTVLHWAASGGKKELVAYLLDRDAPLDPVDIEGRTPLMKAILAGDDEAVEMILDRSPDVHIVDNDGRTALHHAVSKLGDEGFSRLLEVTDAVDLFDSTGASPLHLALAAGEETKTRSLLEYKPKINARDKDGKTYLHLAVEHLPDLVGSVLAQNPNLDAADNEGNTPLHSAVSSGESGPLYLLSRAGGDSSLVNADGDSPAVLAIRNEDAAWLTLTDTPGAVRSADGKGNTPIHLLLEKGWGSALPLLSRYGPDPNRQNDAGQSYLHIAAARNDSHAAAVLLRMGADFTLTDSSGATPLHTAAAHGALEVLTVLLEAGADPTAKNGADETAVDIARASEHIQCADFLRTYRRSKRSSRRNRSAEDET